MLTSFEQSGAGTLGPYQPELGNPGFMSVDWDGRVASGRVGIYIGRVSEDISRGGEGGKTVNSWWGTGEKGHALVCGGTAPSTTGGMSATRR
jgi:hypothetical protein